MPTKTIGKKTFEQMLAEWEAVVPAEAEPPEGFLPLDVIAKDIAKRKGITYTASSQFLRKMFLDGAIEKVDGPRIFQGKRCSNVWYRPK